MFRAAFTAAGLDYSIPHTIRDTLTVLGGRVCQTPEEFRTWSKSLGHKEVLTALTSYGDVTEDRQSAIMNNLAERMRGGQENGFRKKDCEPEQDTIDWVLDHQKALRTGS